MEPLSSDHPLIVYMDIKSPYAFVALEPTLQLEAELGVEFDWRPLTLDIPSYLGSAQKKDGRVVQSERSKVQWNMIRYAYGDARRYAEMQGHILKGTEKIWDSRRINIGILWTVETARERLPDYLRYVYPRFWRRELDIEDLAVVKTCLTEAGIVTEGFEAFVDGIGGARHDALQETLHPAGIFGVPTYVIDGEYYFGREHLPLMRWMLTGRKGPAPDMAYEVSA